MSILEVLMIVCFGVAWPINLYNSFKSKSTKGKSCPSRHTACAVIIALACMYISLPFGIVMMIIALLIAASRPVMGVHFPLDVVFGAVLSLAVGVVGFRVI